MDRKIIIISLILFPSINGQLQSRDLIFPTGTKLEIQYKFFFPGPGFETGTVTSEFQIVFPITVHYDQLEYNKGIIAKSDRMRRIFKDNVWKYSNQTMPQGHLSKNRILVDKFAKNSERMSLLDQISHFLAKFGLDGRACVLRAICELEKNPLTHSKYGLFGEFIGLLFIRSQKEKYFQNTKEFAEAQIRGISGNCGIYKNICPFSIFKF